MSWDGKMISELIAWLLSGAIVNGPSKAKERFNKRIGTQLNRNIENMVQIDNEILLKYNISYIVYSVEYDTEFDSLEIVLHVFGDVDNPNDELIFKCTLYNNSGIPFAKSHGNILLDEEFNEMDFCFFDIKEAIAKISIEPCE